MDNLKSNIGKNLIIVVENEKWERLPIKTHIITKDDEIIDVVKKYATPFLLKNDILFISERIVAISQGRAWPIKDIKPSFFAKFLVKFVHKSPYGIGLGSPWTMELAIREAGVLRIIVGALISAITKPFGIKGVFYRIVGKNINAIDGPCDYTLPPYNEYAKLGPANPEKVAKLLCKEINCDVVIIDANDLGVAILGKSNKDIPDDFCKNVFKDNPLGQSTEQTPLCIVRKVL
ncbi:MAG: coenzyme F420-0:L-glutamate ligase [Patescibacteria group bacterium]|nr:coenzyme F420-0:L-glutamate ligase [Patescibacteria group bacterium]MBU0880071.1 coenzyme F420-0:L-glutamate ligase [Patescibacteria group bacterium]MBU0897818.1 coenzyme F420-0:L-glutamate ligase [Patescibacteria group bacterium]MBU1783012.1 coenzyme F420-0:L-glutamate ligase [Patescibacteria group bacterium]MBU2081650.1 coenzyme F420-0:L-glutamate ligase [Patescibacteria group bacterium]